MDLKKLLYSFKNAFTGIGHTFHTQQSFRLQVIFAIIIIIAGIFLGLNLIGWMLIATCIIGVIIAEMINTAVELTIDLVTRKRSKRAGLAKDVAAGAVLIIAIWSVIIGIIIFIPKIGALI